MPASPRANRPLAHGWLALALAAELLLALFDGLANESVILTTSYVIVPLALAIVAGPREVALVTGISFTLALASGKWNDILFSTDHVVRLAVVLVGGTLAVLSASARQSAVEAHDDADEARSEADAARRRLDAILGSLAEAVTVHDARGKTIYANDAAVRLMGTRDLDELLAAEPGELAERFDMTSEDGSPVRTEELPGRRAVRGETAEPMLTRSVHRATGRESWLVTKATVVRDVDGEPLAVNIIEDVTVAKEAERRQRFLAEAGRILTGSLDAGATMEQLAQLAVPGLADWIAVDLVGADGRMERIAQAGSPDAQPQLDPEESEALLANVAEDVEQPIAAQPLGGRQAMLVPMRAGEQTIGVMTFASAQTGRAFGEADLAFAQDIALRAAAAIENARLYSDRDQAAATLQASLLPERLPQLPGWDASAVYRPGEVGSEVGGDFYDLFDGRGRHDGGARGRHRQGRGGGRARPRWPVTPRAPPRASTPIPPRCSPSSTTCCASSPGSPS